MEPKVFYKMLVELEHSPHKTPQFLKNPELTAVERRILEAQTWVRDGKHEKAIDALKKMPASDSAMIEGHRRLIMGVASHHLHRHQDAEIHLKDAAHAMEFLGLEHSLFQVHFHLFQHYCQLEDFENMRMHLGTLKGIPVHSVDQEIRLLRCQFMYHSELMDFSKAEEYLAILKLKKREMNEGERAGLLVSKFKYYLRLDDFVKCQEVLDQLKHQRKFKTKEKYKYMKMLFDHVVKDEPIVVAEMSTIQSPIWVHQVKVIQALAVGNEKKAAKHWDDLIQVNPELYRKGFHYRGVKSLFSLCIEKHRPSARKSTRKKAA